MKKTEDTVDVFSALVTLGICFIIGGLLFANKNKTKKTNEFTPDTSRPLHNMNMKELDDCMNYYVGKEMYKEAIPYRDEMNRRKKAIPQI